MAYKDYKTGSIISDEEFGEACIECVCMGFLREVTLSLPCDGEICNCPYFGRLKE